MKKWCKICFVGIPHIECHRVFRPSCAVGKLISPVRSSRVCLLLPELSGLGLASGLGLGRTSASLALSHPRNPWHVGCRTALVLEAGGKAAAAVRKSGRAPCAAAAAEAARHGGGCMDAAAAFALRRLVVLVQVPVSRAGLSDHCRPSVTRLFTSIGVEHVPRFTMTCA